MRYLIIPIIFCCAASAFADSHLVTMRGRVDTTLTTPTVKLGDITEISASAGVDDEVIIGLKKIEIGRSPTPGGEKRFQGEEVVQRLRNAGVDLSVIGYWFPEELKVRRAGRLLSLTEVREVVEAALKVVRPDAQLKGVNYTENINVPPGSANLRAEPFATAVAGQQGFTLIAEVTQDQPITFPVIATVDEWKNLPIATRALRKGDVVAAEDVMMARLNLNAIPKDALSDSGQIIGFEASANVNSGEVFRRGKLITPPLINVGEHVTLKYASTFLEASASGIALEAGAQGQAIKVRNESSKKVVTGQVLEAGIVGVAP